MNGGYLALTIGILVITTIALVVAAFFDRRRAREIEHDLHEMGQAWSGPAPRRTDEPHRDRKEE
jgi:hypothetical protein